MPTKTSKQICRICLEFIQDDCINLNTCIITEDILALHVVAYCLKELDLSRTVQKTVCKPCLESIKILYSLKCQVAKTETIIFNYCEANQIDPTDKIDLNYVKNEQELQHISKNIDTTFDSITAIIENKTNADALDKIKENLNVSNDENFINDIEVIELTTKEGEVVEESNNVSRVNVLSDIKVVEPTKEKVVEKDNIVEPNANNKIVTIDVVELTDSEGESPTTVSENTEVTKEVVTDKNKRITPILPVDNKIENVEENKEVVTDKNKKTKIKGKNKPRPYCCLICGKAYTDTFLVKYHLNSKHKNETNIPYKCNFCNYTSPQEDFSKKHYYEVHYKELKKARRKKLAKKKLKMKELPEKEIIPNPDKAMPNLTDVSSFTKVTEENVSKNDTVTLCDELNTMLGDIV